MARTVLGSNSLIDLWSLAVQRQSKRARLSIRTPQQPDTLNKASIDAGAFDRFDGLRHAMGPSLPPIARLEMQKAMQADAAVFRTDKTLAEGVDGDDRHCRPQS